MGGQTRVQYGRPYKFPEVQADLQEEELRRQVKDLSFFPTEQFVKPGVIIAEADLDAANSYFMEPDDHTLLAAFAATAIYSLFLPEPDEADASIYTIKKTTTTASTILIGTRGSARVEGLAGTSLAAMDVSGGTFIVANFEHDGTDWWRVV